MADQYIKRIRTEDGDKQIDYGALANLPDLGTLEKQIEEIDLTPTDSKYFDIDYDGFISIKPEYRGHSNKADFPYSISDNGVDVDGSKNSELPKRIVIPEVIDNTVVTGFKDGMFIYNYAVEEIVFPKTVTVIPDSFCRAAKHLRSIKNTEHITKVGSRAFLSCRITEAMFPNLKELSERAFIQCALLFAVDIGDEITEIPVNCFANCQKLSFVKGGAKVTKLGVEAFTYTYNLKNLSFLPQVTSIGNRCFYCSRIQFDWSSINGTCTFGTYSTPIMDNTTDYWSNCTYTECENRLVTLMNQMNPLWKDEKFGNTTYTYELACSVFTALIIHSAFTGKIYNTPQEFEAELAEIDPTLLDTLPSSVTALNGVFTALGYETTYYGNDLTQANLQDVFNSLANGAYVVVSQSSASNINAGHAVVAYGVNAIGEILFADPGAGTYSVELYDEGFTHRIPFQNITGPSSDILIVRRP